MKKQRLIIPFLSVSFAFQASANDSSYGGDGASVFSIDENRIQMVKEVIRISQAEDKAPMRWKADCTFTFTNLSTESVEVRMGFPDWRWFGDAAVENGKKWAIHNFKTKVDGKKVATIHQELVPNPKLQSRVGNQYKAAYLWPVHFKGSQTREVFNSYYFNGFSTVTAVKDLLIYRDYESYAKHMFWEVPTKEAIKRYKKAYDAYFTANLPKEKQAAKLIQDEYDKAYKALRVHKSGTTDFGNSMYYQIKYIVQSGRSWFQPIKSADIRFELPKNTFAHLVMISEPGFHVGENHIAWNKTNWTPEKDIQLTFVRPFVSEGENLPIFQSLNQAKKWIEIAKRGKWNKKHLDILWAAYYAMHGDFRVLTKSEWEAYFKNYGHELPKKKTPLKKEELEIVSLLKRQMQSKNFSIIPKEFLFK